MLKLSHTLCSERYRKTKLINSSILIYIYVYMLESDNRIIFMQYENYYTVISWFNSNNFDNDNHELASFIYKVY